MLLYERLKLGRHLQGMTGNARPEIVLRREQILLHNYFGHRTHGFTIVKNQG